MLKLILTFVSGVGLFLFGIYTIDKCFDKNYSLSPKTEKLFGKPFFSFVCGVFSAAITQSSSAINSVLTALRDKEKISEKTTFFAIAGSNIGTTATAYLALMQNVSVGAIFSSLVFFSVLFLMLTKKEKSKKYALAVSGFSVIFISFSIIKNAVPELVKNIRPDFLFSPNPFVPFFVCLILTALCQSSSLVSVLIISFAKINALTLPNALFMIMAANIGTCSTIFLVSLGKTKKSVRVATFNFIFNLIPAIFFIVAYYSRMLDFFLGLNVAMDTKIALFHTLFNVAACILVCPFIGWFIDENYEKKEKISYFLSKKKPAVKKRA